MGNNLSVIKDKQNKDPPKSRLFDLSLTKLREYHGSFKSVCENFSMDYEEFNEIFEESEETFKLWDNNDNGLIDGLVLFSGLILFSNAKFQEKIRFIFDLFDLNELNSLSLVDIQYMINCCVESSIRISGSHEEVTHDDIQKFVTKSLKKDSRVNISQLIKFCCDSQEIQEFLTVIKRDLPFKEKLTINEFIRKLEDPEFAIPKYLKRRVKIQEKIASGTGECLNSIKHRKKMDFLSNFVEKMEEKRKKDNINTKVSQISNSQVQLNWVYGFRCNDLVQTFLFHQDKEKKDSCRLIYFVANIVVIFFYKQNLQKHYMEHSNQVCSISLGKYSNLVATGDCGLTPFIHIWDLDTLQTKQSIRCDHSKDIYIVQFLQKDRYLAALGLRSDTPLVIYDLENNSTVINCYVSSFVQRLVTIDVWVGESHFGTASKTFEGIDLESSFFAFSDFKIFFFKFNTEINSYEKKTYVTHLGEGQARIEECKWNKITTLASFYFNQKNPEQVIYGNKEQFELVVVTGHSQGQINLWQNFQEDGSVSKTQLTQIKNGVEIIKCFQKKYLLILTSESQILLWSMAENRNIKEFELTLLPVRLKSMKIKNICKGEGDRVIFSTWEGDLVQMSLKYRKEWNEHFYVQTIEAERFSGVLELQNEFSCLCILEREQEKLVFVGGSKDSQIYGFSSKEHRLIDKWSIGDSVSAMDCLNTQDGGIVFVFGTYKGKIVLRYDWEEYPKSYICGSRILAIKFSPNCGHIIAASENKNIYIFPYMNNSYFKFLPIIIAFDSIPISLNFSSNYKSVIVGTKSNIHYKVDLPDPKHKDHIKNFEEIKNSDDIKISKMKMKFPIENKLGEVDSLPIIFGSEIKMIIGGDENGYLTVWNNKEELKNNAGTSYLGHGSQIIDLAISRNRDSIFTISKFDNAVFEWKINFNMVLQEDQENSKKSLELIDRELLASTSNNLEPQLLKDSFGLFKGNTVQNLNDLFSQYKSKNKDKLSKVYPPYTLQLEHVYGFNCFDKRNTLLYCHSRKKMEGKGSVIAKEQHHANKYNLQDTVNLAMMGSSNRRGSRIPKRSLNLLLSSLRNSITQLTQKKGSIMKAGPSRFAKPKQQNNQTSSSIIEDINDSYDNSQYESQVMDSKRVSTLNKKSYDFSLLQRKKQDYLDELIHMLEVTGESQTEGFCNREDEQCQRELVYISSRIAIIIQPEQNQAQRFYQGHQKKISCITIHKDKKLVATGEAGVSPQIHIWHAQNCSNVRIIDTYHKVGIVTLKFSNQRHFIYSVGVDKRMSIQVTDWLNNKVLGFRFAQSEKILQLEVHPSDPNVFVTGSFGYIDFWKLAGNSIVHQKKVRIGSNFVTNLNYIIYDLDGCQQSDLLITTHVGEVGIVRGDVYLDCSQLKHKGMVNCLKTFKIRNKLYFITASEDKNIYISDLSLTKVMELNLESQVDTYPDFKQIKEKNLTIQSLDIFLCGQNEQEPNILLGCRGGDIIEIKLLYSQDRKFFFKSANLLVRNHSSQHLHIPNSTNPMDFLHFKKIKITMHPKHDIFASIGEDKYLKCWDFQSKKPIFLKELTHYPTVCKFSPDGEHLVIGFKNGTLQVYKPKIKKESQEATGNCFEMDIGKDLFSTIKEQKVNTAVLNIVFSKNGDFMAVSYDNQNVNLEKEDTSKEQGNSFVIVYIRRDSEKAQHTAVLKTGDENSNKPYLKYTDVKVRAENIQQKDEFGQAIYFMSFSDGEKYLMLQFQQINNYQVRFNDDSIGNYPIWNLESNNIDAKHKQKLKQVQFNSCSFPNHIYGLSKIYPENEDMNQTDQEKFNLEDLENNRFIISAIKDNETFSFLGTQDGRIFILKNSFLIMERDMLPSDRSVTMDQFVQARGYAGHCSFVDAIEVSNKFDRLFTTGVSDEAIFQWKFKKIEAIHELDHQTCQLQNEDLFLFNVLPKNRFDALRTQIFPMRQKILDIREQLDVGVFPEYRLEPYRIIGRKAFERRNNIIVTKNKQCVYHTGTTLVIFDLHSNINGENSELDPSLEKQKLEGKSLKQYFVMPDKIKVPAEISCFAMSPNQKFICYGTIETNSNLRILDVSNYSLVNEFKVSELVIPLIIKFSSDSNFLVILGTTAYYHSSLYFVDPFKGKTLAIISFSYSLPFKIKDLDFLPGSNDTFLTVGIQHISKWQYKAGILEFQEIKIDNDLEKRRVQQNELEIDDQLNSEENEFTSFLTLKFLFANIFVTCCDAGNLYLWMDYQIRQKITVCEKVSILVIEKSIEFDTDFVIGNQQGEIFYYRLIENNQSWQLVQLFKVSLQKLNKYQVFKEFKSLQSLKFCEQNHLIFGTRNGNIGEIKIDFDYKGFEKELKETIGQQGMENQEQINALNQRFQAKTSQNIYVSFFDHQNPEACCFSKNQKYLLVLTQNGLFSVYELATLNIVTQINFEKKTKDMILLTDIIVIAFEKSIQVLHNSERDLRQNFKLIPSWEIQTTQKVLKVKITPNEKLMAVSFEENINDNSDAKVTFFRLEELKFAQFTEINDMENVILMDFSKDDQFMICQDIKGNRYCFDMSNQTKIEKIETLGLDYQINIQWQSEGLILSEKIRNIHRFYNEIDNEITNIVQLSDNCIAITDEIGTIRLFEYPCLDNGFYRLESCHLSFITIANSCENYFVTGGAFDKNLIVWKIMRNNPNSFKKDAIEEYVGFKIVR